LTSKRYRPTVSASEIALILVLLKRVDGAIVR
jgi:hypothetical protein